MNEVMTKQQYADLWGISLVMLDKLIKQGLPVVRISPKVMRILPANANNWMQLRFETGDWKLCYPAQPQPLSQNVEEQQQAPPGSKAPLPSVAEEMHRGFATGEG